MPEQIKVRFKRLYVIDDSDTFGDGEFYFIASVDGKQVGNPRTIFPAVETKYIDLPENDWSTIVTVDGKSKVVVKFQGKEEDVIWDDTLGDPLEHHLKPPWGQDVRTYTTDYYQLEWQVEKMVDGKFGLHPPDDVYACRQNAGSLSCTTISGQPLQARIEIHDVRPTPDPTGAPARPAFPATAAPPKTNQGNTTVTAASPVNVVPNPAVIPILTGADITSDNAARIEVTYFRPDSLNFTDSDPRLVWTAVPVAGGAVTFLGYNGGTPAVGTKVLIYGTAPGEVRLEVRLKGTLAATYRALVLPVKQITCRFNILNGTAANAKPNVTPAQIRDMMTIANRWFRQLAVELVLDTNTHKGNGAVAVPGIPGIFTISVGNGVTRNVPDSGFSAATLLNARAGVLNFAYIVSTHDHNTLGAADSYPASKSGVSIQDSGTPSSSWTSPCGVDPESAAGTVTMKLLAARARPGHPKLYSMYICDQHGAALTQQTPLEAANTIAHEVGHILNLGHRIEGVPESAPGAGDQRDMTAADLPGALVAGGIYWDGRLQPPNENVMHWSNPATQAQDFDILQARAVRQSPLLT